MKNNEINRAKQDALDTVNAIVDMVNKLKQLQCYEDVDISDYCDYDDEYMSIKKKIKILEEVIQNYPLCINTKKENAYEIELACGGPSVHIIGELNNYKQPISAEIEYCDWGTGWVKLSLSSLQRSVLLDFARRFYYEEL